MVFTRTQKRKIDDLQQTNASDENLEVQDDFSNIRLTKKKRKTKKTVTKPVSTKSVCIQTECIQTDTETSDDSFINDESESIGISESESSKHIEENEEGNDETTEQTSNGSEELEKILDESRSSNGEDENEDEDEYENEYETNLNILEYYDKNNNTFHNIFEKYKDNESFLLKCHTIKYLSSQGELKCSQILSKHKDIKLIKKQYIFNDCININPLPFDFYIELKNGIYFLLEYHGQQHYKEVPLWDGEDGFKERQYRDNIKIDYCKKHNIPLCIISYRQFNNIENEINLFINNFIEKPDHTTIKTEKTILDFI